MLSKTELKVLEAVAKGLSNKEIGKSFNRSRKTIENHVSAILSKLQVKNRTSAVVKALKLNLLKEGIHA